MKTLATNGDGWYLVDLTPTASSDLEMHMATVVDLPRGSVKVPVRLGSILAQGEPDEWDFTLTDEPDGLRELLDEHAPKLRAAVKGALG